MSAVALSMPEANKLQLVRNQYKRLGITGVPDILPFTQEIGSIDLALDEKKDVVGVHSPSSAGRLKRSDGGVLSSQSQHYQRQQQWYRAKAGGGGDQSDVSPPPLPLSWPPVPAVLTVEAITTPPEAREKSWKQRKEMRLGVPEGPSSSSSSSSSSSKGKKEKIEDDKAVTFTSGSGKVTGALCGEEGGGVGTQEERGINVEIDPMIIQDTSGTVFDGDETDELDVSVEIIFGDLEDEFVRQKKRKSVSVMRRVSKHVGMNGGSSPERSKTSSKKFNTQTSDISALDPRRDHNLSIMLARFGRQSCANIAATVHFEYEKLGPRHPQPSRSTSPPNPRSKVWVSTWSCLRYRTRARTGRWSGEKSFRGCRGRSSTCTT